MAAAKFVTFLALLQLSAAWLLPPQAENFTFDNETANCSVSTYEDWLEMQPQPVFVDTLPGAPEPEEAEEVEDYVEPEVGIDEDVDPSDSESTDSDDDDSEYELDDSDDDLQDFIVNDDVRYNRFRRDVIGVDIPPTEGAMQEEGGYTNDMIPDNNEAGGDESKSSEEDGDESKSSEEHGDESKSSEEESEEEDDDPYAYLHIKGNRSSGGMLTPQDSVKVMLKNFQKSRMNFLVTVSSYDEDDVDNTGSFASQPFLIKLRGCWLQHKHNAHKICKHNHGRKHGHGHGRGRGHGRGHRHHGRDHHRQQEDHQSERHPLAEANEVDTESVRGQENDTAFDFKSHKFMESAEGEASLCSPTQLEGWLGPESKVVIAYSVPERGCVVIRAYASFPIYNGSIVLTSEGNEEYLQYLNCVDPNHIPEEDRDYDLDYETNDITYDSYDDGIDTANIIDDDTSPDDDEDDEDHSFTPIRGREGYNLRPRQPRNRSAGSSEEVDDAEEHDEDYTPNFRDQERLRRSASELNDQQLRWRQMRQERRRHRRQGGHSHRNADDDTASPATNLVEETTGRALDARQQRRQERKQRRQQRLGRRQGAETTEATSEGTPVGGRRGRGGRRNRPNRPNRRNRHHANNNRLLHSNLTDQGSKFCCKQGIQHKKASTYPADDGTTPAVNCAVVPVEVPVWAAHKHPINKEACEAQYVRCCNEFDLDLWNTFKEKREVRRAQRGNRQHG